jgi:2-methylcitrate dehydratase
MSANVENNQKPAYDSLFESLAEYVLSDLPDSLLSRETARYCLMDTLGCGLLALRFPECTKHLGPIVEGTVVPGGSRIPGTSYRLDPIKAAWDIGCMIRWLDFNDTWLAAEWGHPSDNLGAILAVLDFLAQKQRHRGESPVRMSKLLEAMIKAHEIQGVLALNHAFNRVGLDHVLLVKVASTAVVTWLKGGDRQQIMDAISHAWIDGQALRTYRHAPNAGSRKSWAAGDATSRAVRLADLVMRGEMGYPSALSAPKWGFQEVLFEGKALQLERPLTTYVMDNILFKIAFPAEFHAQTAVEAALALHHEVITRLDDIESIRIYTHESAIRIISKQGVMNNPADRDHCLQYMIAVPLLFGDLVAEHYETDFHQAHPEIDQLRDRMQVFEDAQYTKDYLDPEKRSIANALEIHYRDGSQSRRVVVEYPIGHKRRREEGIPKLIEKFRTNLKTRLPQNRVDHLITLCSTQDVLESMAVDDFMDLWVI